MEGLLFYLFSAMAIGCGLLVVANPLSRNPVTSAMCLVLTMISLAGLFVLLQAYFLAAIQILVYAGAVMVLFLFVIMLLDLKEEEHRHTGWARLALGLAGAGGCGALLVGTITGARTAPLNQTAATMEGGAKSLGSLLFSGYLLPFEVMSILLLVGMIGVVILSKKELK
jgi:NADH-quinone oxidoreductase subunit J